MFKSKRITFVLVAATILTGCATTPNDNLDCNIIKGGPTICEKPQKPKVRKFVDDLFEATESNAKAGDARIKAQHRKEKNKIEGDDVAVGFFTAIFKLFDGLFGSKND